MKPAGNSKARIFLSFTILLTLFLSTSLPAKEKKSERQAAQEELADLIAKAEPALERGQDSKAAKLFERAHFVSGGQCRDCLRGLLRAQAGQKKWAAAALSAGALLDLAAEEGGGTADPALVEEVEKIFRAALDPNGDGNATGNGGGTDLDVLRGLFMTLARRDAASEIVRLAESRLESEEERAAICAADYRSALDPPESLPFAEAVNQQLSGLGWEGPFLIADAVRQPRPRVKPFGDAKRFGARFVGVVDRMGFIRHFTLVRPPWGKVEGGIYDSIRRSTYDAATHRGERLAVCYPFAVALPDVETPILARGAIDPEAGPSPVYETVAGLGNAEDVLRIITEVGTEIPLMQRAAICAAPVYWQDGLDRQLVKLGWPGPYFQIEDVTAPVAKETPAPEYTEEARAEAYAGDVKLMTVVDAEGKVVHVEVLQGLLGGLTKQAVTAVKKWTFEPARRGEEAVMVCHELTVTFTFVP